MCSKSLGQPIDQGEVMYPEDVDPQSGCRLPLPRRQELDEAGQRIYDSLVDPKGETIRGLRGPGGIFLHSPELSRYSRPLNHYLRREAGLGGRVRELAILTTARELDSHPVPMRGQQNISVRDGLLTVT